MDCPSPGISCFLFPFKGKEKGEASGTEPGIPISPSGKERPRTRKPPSGRRGLGLRGKQDETRPVRARRPSPGNRAFEESGMPKRFGMPLSSKARFPGLGRLARTGRVSSCFPRSPRPRRPDGGFRVRGLSFPEGEIGIPGSVPEASPFSFPLKGKRKQEIPGEGQSKPFVSRCYRLLNFPVRMPPWPKTFTTYKPLDKDCTLSVTFSSEPENVSRRARFPCTV